MGYLTEYDKLGLYYKVQIAEFSKTSTLYSVYFEEEPTDERCVEIRRAVWDYFKPYEDRINMFCIDEITRYDGKIYIRLNPDFIDDEYDETITNGILLAMNNLPGIKKVVFNEDCVKNG